MADKEHKKVIIKKVKKGGHGGHHGGSWKVAYADFVTAMMAFFLVMWLVNSLPQEKREQVAQYFQSFSLFDNGAQPSLIPATDISQIQKENNPPAIVQPISESPAGAAKEKTEAEKMAEALKEAVETKTPDLKQQVTVKTEADKVIFELSEDAKGKPLFALGKADLTPDARRVLEAVAPKLAQAGKGALTIEGHTDAYTYAGDRFTNWELSTERASGARRVLEKAGVSGEAVGMVAGFAATRPMVPANVYDPKNRRIRLVLEVPNAKKSSEAGAQGQGGAGSGSGPGQAGDAKAKKGPGNMFVEPEAPPPPPESPIPREKREILDQQIERLYDEQIKGKP
ncbi:flagellar motor protein MotB [Fundidesulfovibrio agrisoli]|uniref:flagellar motor protein MotB n=1 Tax=Fundidesulfovibrio agrisoli TaxID=2922717 RepID=UPI001FABE5B5|nr:flagellar motor protein MotB [Fundidesulfovibrio agrisoli]